MTVSTLSGENWGSFPIDFERQKLEKFSLPPKKNGGKIPNPRESGGLAALAPADPPGRSL